MDRAMLPGRKFSEHDVRRAARRVGWRAIKVPAGFGTHRSGGDALVDADRCYVGGLGFDMTADDVAPGVRLKR
jgi:hypothetical protein